MQFWLWQSFRREVRKVRGEERNSATLAEKRCQSLLKSSGRGRNRIFRGYSDIAYSVTATVALKCKRCDSLIEVAISYFVDRTHRAMRMAIDELRAYLEENSGSILIFVGVILLVVGLMFVSTFGSTVSVYTFFFGIIFVAFGFFARLGIFHIKLRSLTGLGTLLVCVSVVFFALSISLMAFLAVKGVFSVPQYVRGFLQGYATIVSLYRPYAWLSATSIWISLATFLAGLIARVYAARR